MAKAKFDIKTEATRPLYAYVGVTDRAVEVVRESVLDFQKRIADFDFEPKALRNRATTLVSSRVDDLQERYDELVTRGETLVERIRKQDSTQDAAASAKTSVAKARTTRTQATKAARTTTAKAKDAATTTTSTAKKQAGRPKSSAKATGTTAKRAATSAAKATVDGTKKVGD
jgi:peptidoglycan hydrolase CwlO-like protein